MGTMESSGRETNWLLFFLRIILYKTVLSVGSCSKRKFIGNHVIPTISTSGGLFSLRFDASRSFGHTKAAATIHMVSVFRQIRMSWVKNTPVTGTELNRWLVENRTLITLSPSFSHNHNSVENYPK